MEGETGGNLQVCYARLCTALANIGSIPSPEDILNTDYSSLWDDTWCDLIRLIARYPAVVNAAFKTLEPGTILSYLFLVVEQLTDCLDEADEEESEGGGSSGASKYAARAVLYENVRLVLENAMKLLGATPISN